MIEVQVNEKFALTLYEAAEYYHIGIKKMRKLADDNLGNFAVRSGNRLIIIRTKFEDFLMNNSTI